MGNSMIIGRRSIRKTAVYLLCFLFPALLFAACGGGVGVCDSTARYCKDGWTEEECTEWNSMNVNGEDWYFHDGQTCAERGKVATP